jgi:hypothetical protein
MTSTAARASRILIWHGKGVAKTFKKTYIRNIGKALELLCDIPEGDEAAMIFEKSKRRIRVIPVLATITTSKI